MVVASMLSSPRCIPAINGFDSDVTYLIRHRSALGFRAGDANLYRYVHNSPTNFIDPSGQVEKWKEQASTYAERFWKSVGSLFKRRQSGWRVHHRIQQADTLAKRYYLERGIRVQDLNNLVAVPDCVHQEINRQQQQFWRKKAVDFGLKPNDTCAPS